MDFSSSPWAGVDGPSLSRAAAALQLVPGNIPCLLRVQRLSAAAAGMKPETDAPRLSGTTLRALLRHPYIVDENVLSHEDVYDDVYVDEVGFDGGPRLVLQGLTNRSAHTARILLGSIFGPPGDLLPDAYKGDAWNLARGVLTVSDQVCRAAGLRRGLPPPATPSEQVQIPNRERMRELESAVSLTAENLSRILSPESRLSLGRLSVRAGTHPTDLSGISDDGMILHPLLEFGDNLIVANPSELAASLRHHLIVLAVEHDCHVQLAEAFHRSVVSQTQRVLVEMGCVPLERATIQANGFISTQRFRGVANTFVDLGVATDDFSDFDQNNPFGYWRAMPGAELQAVLDPEGPESLDDARTLRLAITDGIARQTFIGVEAHRRSGPMLFLTLDELQVIIRLDGDDPLLLWRFAEAQREFNERVRTFSFSALDDYAIFRSHDQSFYLSDDRMPSFLSVSPGSGVDLRVEAHQALDAHEVLAPDGGVYINLVAYYQSYSVPIYVVDPLHSLRAFVVEVDDVRIWIRPDHRVDDAFVPFMRVVAEAVAYWSWRLYPHIRESMRDASDENSNISILLALSDAEAWGMLLVGRSQDGNVGSAELVDGSSWVSADGPSAGRLILWLDAEGVDLPDSHSNRGDRRIVQTLLSAFAPEISTDDLLAVLLPGPQTKMLQVIGQSNILLQPTSTDARLVIPAVTARILDSLGVWLAEQGVAEGQIAPDERTEVLRRAVDFYVQNIERALGKLSAKGLLEYVVSKDEALLREGTLRNDHLDSRLACFGIDSAPVHDLARTESKHAEASVASRFLVEFISANPPAGNIEIDLFVYDELLALAADLISRATLSDAIHFGFSDVQLSVLPSGRLGVSRGDRYTAGTTALLETEMEARRSLAKEPSSSGASSTFPLEAMNQALAAEVGFSLSDLVSVMGVLIDMASGSRGDFFSAEEEVVAAELRQKLTWTHSKVQRVVDTLSLGQMQSFISNRDSWPWKYNRDRSYIRRPLLRFHDEQDRAMLAWGVRRLWVTPRYWSDLLTGARFKGQSKEMTRFVGTVRQAQNKRFEGETENGLAVAGMPVTATSVKRIGKLRLLGDRGEDLGDIDAIGLDPIRRLIVVAEAKDFELARTPVELSNEVKDLLEGEKSAAFKVARRASWVRKNLHAVLVHFDLSTTNSKLWKVVPVIVTSRNLMGPRVSPSSVDVVSIDALVPWVGQMRVKGSARARRAR